MNTVKLFSEAVEEVQYITEAKEGGGKNYKIKGIFLQADIKNRNGRIYPMEILQKEVTRYNKKFINEKRAYGELGHPEGPTVNLERVSHMVTELYPDGKNFIGEAKIMETPMGKIVKNIMNEGGKLGVSSRGMGSLNQKNGANYVRDDFYLATAADIVADPSAPNAFVEGIMEGKEWVWNNGALIESELVELRRKFDVKKRNRDAKVEALEFAKFLKKL
ncbi:MAG: primosomal protein [Thaumarchaeota archaeon]|nr:primosomal protein [Nitrososphaerota archaeon]